MYLEASFSTRAYIQPTEQQYADMREGKEVTVEQMKQWTQKAKEKWNKK